MFTLFFNKNKVENYKTAKESSVKLFARFHKELLKGNIYFPPSQFESCFLSAGHSDQDIIITAKAISNAFEDI